MKFNSKLIAISAVLTAAAVAGAASPAAAARDSYDGGWTVTIMTLRGECDSGSSFGVEIRDGSVHGYGGFDVRGHVAPSGAVQVRVSSGSASADGSGRLYGSSGGGTWHGRGSRGACYGQWTASRR